MNGVLDRLQIAYDCLKQAEAEEDAAKRDALIFLAQHKREEAKIQQGVADTKAKWFGGCQYCGVRNLDDERVSCKQCGAPLRNLYVSQV